MKPDPIPSSASSDRDLAAVATSLRRLASAVDIPAIAGLTAEALDPMPVRGIAHDHIRLIGHGMVLRIPRLSQFGMEADRNLAYQAACFRRAGPSAATPALHAILQPGGSLPFGALLVEEIEGRMARLPDDLPPMATALASIHRLAVPPEERRPPLQNHSDPVAAIVDLICRQATYMERTGIAEPARRQITDEIAWARAFAGKSVHLPHPVTLVVTDTQPGNFLVDTRGRAFAVDLEKALYGSPAVDLAHATLYTSTRWDPEVDCRLSLDAVRGFEHAWLEAAGPELAAATEPWLAPMRRLTWLRSTTFFMKWLVESAGSGDWSAERLGPALAAHFRRHILDCLDPGTIEHIRSEWGA